MSFKSVILAVAALSMFVSCARQDETSVPALKVQGTALYQDGSDRPVVWHGFSFGWHNIWPRFYNTEAVKVLVNEWGCPVLRAAIGADDLEEACPLGGYRSDPQSALNCLYAVVDAAIENNVYVIVDWHSHLLHQDDAVEFFRTVATKYAGCPNVIYE
ncbi:MAG: cellulase family glycosylhydrolase, partial [Bacteroidales bacterium]|nr:cellulase family glycosylhydrolase [Candidatus Cryptobacteroides fimicaballi]